MKQTKPEKPARGFTLIEIIISLILVGILAAMMVTYMSSAVARSTEPLTTGIKYETLTQVMENIIADYLNLADRDDCVIELKSRIGTGDSDASTGYGAYQATTTWIYFNSSGNAVTISNPTEAQKKILAVRLNPSDGDTSVKLTRLFTATTEE